MRRALASRAVRLSVLGIVVAALGGLGAPAQAERTPPPSRLLVNAMEWSYLLSRSELPPGPAIVELYNRGEDPHDLTIRRMGGTRERSVGKTLPGELATIEMKLRRGSRYRLWCTLDGHLERGMEAKLKVTRKRS
jgi:hypothetical protein